MWGPGRRGPGRGAARASAERSADTGRLLVVESDLVRQFLRHRDVLMGFIVALTGDYDLAEEVFQEVAVSILNEANKRAAPSNFMAWARAVARHRVVDHFRGKARRRERHQPLDSLAEAVEQAFGENEVTPDESHRRLAYLAECLRSLGDRARAIVEMRYRQRRPIAGIAAAIGWKPASVKVALSKARRALADCIDRKMRLRGYLVR